MPDTIIDEKQRRVMAAKFRAVDKFLTDNSDFPINATDLRANLEEVMQYINIMPCLNVARKLIPGGQDALQTWKEAYEKTEGQECKVTFHYMNWVSQRYILEVMLKGNVDPAECYTPDQMRAIRWGTKCHDGAARALASLVSLVTDSWINRIRADDQYLQRFYAHIKQCDTCRHNYTNVDLRPPFPIIGENRNS